MNHTLLCVRQLNVGNGNCRSTARTTAPGKSCRGFNQRNYGDFKRTGLLSNIRISYVRVMCPGDGSENRPGEEGNFCV